MVPHAEFEGFSEMFQILQDGQLGPEVGPYDVVLFYTDTPRRLSGGFVLVPLEIYEHLSWTDARLHAGQVNCHTGPMVMVRAKMSELKKLDEATRRET
jgi:hypothetical protein